jgi:hypothetical protein
MVKDVNRVPVLQLSVSGHIHESATLMSSMPRQMPQDDLQRPAV